MALSRSVRQVIDAVQRVTGRPIRVVYGERRSGDPAVLVASCEKAKRELGWEAQHSSIEHIVDSAWRWHVTHPRGYAVTRALDAWNREEGDKKKMQQTHVEQQQSRSQKQQQQSKEKVATVEEEGGKDEKTELVAA